MIKKAFSNQKEIKEFQKKYSAGKLNVEVISNLLQPYYEDKFPEIKEYCDFWWSEDKASFGLKGVLQLMIAQFGPLALKESFGSHDFSFEGNREYKNYVLEFEELIIVAPAKREVIIPENVVGNLHEKLVKFEKAYCQFVVDFIFKNYNRLKSHESNALDELKAAKIIDEKNQVDFEHDMKFINKSKTHKP